MQALWIVKGFDVTEHAEAGFFESTEAFMVGPLVFEGPEEAFHDGIIVAAAGAAHGALDAERPQDLLIGVAGVLATAIAVVQQLLARGSSGLDRVAERRTDQFRGQ